MAKPLPVARAASSRLKIAQNILLRCAFCMFAVPTMIFFYFAVSFLMFFIFVPLGGIVYVFKPELFVQCIDKSSKLLDYYTGSSEGRDHQRSLSESRYQKRRSQVEPQTKPSERHSPEIYLNDKKLRSGEHVPAAKNKNAFDFEIYSDHKDTPPHVPAGPPDAVAPNVGKRLGKMLNDAHDTEYIRDNSSMPVNHSLPYDLSQVEFSPHWSSKTPKSQMSQCSSLAPSRLNSVASSPFTNRSTKRYPSPASGKEVNAAPAMLAKRTAIDPLSQMSMGSLPATYNASIGSARAQTILKNGRKVRYDQLNLGRPEAVDEMQMDHTFSSPSTNDDPESPSKRVRFEDKEEDGEDEDERILNEQLALLSAEMQVEVESESILSAMDDLSNEDEPDSAFSSPDTKHVFKQLFPASSPLHLKLAGSSSETKKKTTIRRSEGKALLSAKSSPIIHKTSPKTAVKKQQRGTSPRNVATPKHSPSHRHLNCLTPMGISSSKLNRFNSSFSPQQTSNLPKLRKTASKTNLRAVSSESTSSVNTIVAASEASID